ncbi:MAG: glycosyl transferase [Myxococcales bacterium]
MKTTTLALIAALACGCATTSTAPAGVPLLERLLAGPVPLDGKAAALASEADAALRDGHPAEASRKLRAALDALPADAPPCSARGALLYAIWKAEALGSASGDPDPIEALRGACTAAEVAPSEAPMATFLGALVFAETNRGAASSPADRPDEWVDEAAIRAWGERAEATTVGADRVTLLRTLAHEALALASEPEGPCDDAWAPARDARLRELRAQLDTLGRQDLTVGATAREALRADGTVDRARIQALTDALNRPDAAWMRQYGLATALGAVGHATLLAADPGALAPLCNAVFEDIAADVRADTAEGWADRNVTRLTAAFGHALSCPSRAPLDALLDDVLARAATAGDGGAGVLAVLVGAGSHLAQAAITGRMDQVFAASDALLRGLDRVRDRLTDAPADQALDALLGALTGAGRLFQTGDPAALGRLAAAADTLLPLSTEPTAPDAPMILKLAPGIHLGALGLLAGVQSIRGDTAAAEATLAVLDQALEDDVALLLRNLDASDHAPAIVRLIRAGRAVVEAAIDPKPTHLEQARGSLEAALAPGPSEAGWWAISLDGARLILVDVLALVASDEKHSPIVRDAMTRAEGVSARLVGSILDHFELRGTGWELLSVLPAVHQVLGRILTEDLAEDETARLLLETLEPPAREALSRLTKAVRDIPSERAAYLDMFIDVLEAATEVGAGRFVSDGDTALRDLGRALLSRGATYPTELRTYAEMAGAALLWAGDRAGAEGALERAATAARSSSIARYSWLPQLLRARLAMSSGDVETALTAADAALAAGQETHRCGKFDAADGILPFRMAALERLGRHAEARVAYRAWAALLDRGFAGDGVIQCRMMSYRGNVVATADVGHQPGSLLLPSGSQDGTFQVGIGFQSTERDHDRLVCTAGPLAARRSDRVLAVHLLAALHALAAGQDLEAHDSLLAAWSEARLIAYGQAQTLGRLGGSAAADAREKAPIALIGWAATAARLRGQAHIAGRLEELAELIATARGTTLREELSTAEPPVILEGSPALLPVGEAARLWYAASTEAELGAASAAMAKAGVRLSPPWGPALSTQVLNASHGRVKEADAGLRALKDPKEPLGKALVGGARVLFRQASSGQVDRASLTAAMEALARAGLPGEAMGLAQQGAALLMSTNDRAGTIALLEAAVAALPEGTHPLVRADLLAHLTEGRLADGMANEALEGLRVMWPALHGRVAPDLELQQRLTTINLLGLGQHWDELAPKVGELVSILAPTVGWGHPTVYSLRAVDVALVARSSEVDASRLDALLEWADAAGADDATAMLRAFREGGLDAAQRRAKAEEFLGRIFGQAP